MKICRNMLISAFALLSVISFSHAALAATTVAPAPFAYGAWIAYWKETTGATDALAHINQLTTIFPFGYSVKATGALTDTAGLDQAPWPDLISKSKAAGLKIIPTIMWSDTDAIYTILSNTTKRNAHIAAIVATTTSQGFDGIDIDYENKKQATKTYFSRFLTDLSAALHKNNKLLYCTIESRTPLGSRFVLIPKDTSYVNDYVVINKVCDKVQIMAYDQSNIDILLNKQKGGTNLYMPIADADWVVKVINETTKTISPKKVILGIPTYGREYQITNTNGKYSYTQLRSLSFRDASALATSVGVTPTRTSAGELGFTYSTTTSNGVISQRYVVFTDNISIAQKVALAKKYNLSGVALFKIDGDSDPQMWNSISLVK